MVWDWSWYAAQKGEDVSAALYTNHVPWCDVGRLALKVAAVNDHVGTLSCLLSAYKRWMDSSHYGHLLVSAAECGSIGAVALLMTRWWRHRDYHLELAVSRAARRGHGDVIRLIAQCDPRALRSSSDINAFWSERCAGHALLRTVRSELGMDDVCEL
jgi:hypothetical protein